MAGIISHIFGKQVDQSLLTSLLSMFDDEKFAKEMLDTHAPADEGDIDAGSLFVLAENTLRGATTIVDGVVNPKVRTVGGGKKQT